MISGMERANNMGDASMDTSIVVSALKDLM